MGNSSSKQHKKRGKPSVTILYGSSGGTAEGFAMQLGALGRQQGHFAVNVVDLQEFEPRVLPSLSYVVFVVATHGEGGPTDSAARFYKFITGPLPAKCLKHVKFTVFGLGDSTYMTYNAMGRTVDTLMAKRAGQRFYPFGQGDARGRIDKDFAAWKEGLWGALLEDDTAANGNDLAVPLSPSGSSRLSNLVTPRLKNLLTNSTSSLSSSSSSTRRHFSSSFLSKEGKATTTS
ncbi:hypothetical protein AC1031_003905 [Aphanomyces cochlioides]|nr:hypothetical protein AC1031_003905 [Aphanomyces cochlioides]